MKPKGKLTRYTEKVGVYINEYLEDIKSIKESGISEFISNRKLSLIVCSLLFMMVGGYFLGNLTMSQSQLYNRLESSLKRGKESELRNIVKINGEKPKRGELQPLLKLYNDSNDKVIMLMKELKGDGKSAHMTIKKDDKILGDDYYIELKVYNVRIDSNYSDGVIYINNKEQISPGQTIRGMVPGIYDIDGVLKSDYGDIIEKKQVVFEKDDIVSINFRASDITVESSFGDAIVFVNNNNTKLQVDEFKNIGPIPHDGSVKLYIEKEFPWGIIKSDEYEVKDISEIKVNMDIANEVLINDINEVVDGFYKSVFISLNEEEKDLIKNATGNATNKIYDELKRKYFILKNKYEMININIKQENNVYSYENGKYRATIVAEVNYDVSKALLGLSKESREKKFFTKLVYENNGWIIDNVENFSL